MEGNPYLTGLYILDHHDMNIRPSPGSQYFMLAYLKTNSSAIYKS